MHKQLLIPARLLIYVSLAAVSLSACKKGNDDPSPNEEEVITTLRVELTDSATSAKTTFQFYDADGDGGLQATIDSIRLMPNHIYFAQLTLLDESTTPVGDITTEIRAEQNVHQFFFHPASPQLTVRYDPNDFDTNTPPKPVGLKTKWTSGIAQRTSLRIVLKHQPLDLSEVY